MKKDELIYKKIPLIMSDLTSIGKDKKNSQQGWSFRGIDDMYNVFKPLLAKHGVFVYPTVLERTRQTVVNSKGTNLFYTILTVRYSFVAEDGSCVDVLIDGEAMDSGDKATSKALSIAQKYAFIQLFCVPTEDLVDPDSESHEVNSSNTATNKLNQTKTNLLQQHNKEQTQMPNVFLDADIGLSQLRELKKLIEDTATEEQKLLEFCKNKYGKSNLVDLNFKEYDALKEMLKKKLDEKNKTGETKT